MVTEIDWVLLGKAVSYYKENAFKYIEAPWIVDKHIMMITCPLDRNIINSDIGCLVGSAEQSFIHLMNERMVDPDTNYVALTPCFRNEPETKLNKKYFLKVELFVYNPKNSWDSLHNFINLSRNFFDANSDYKTEIVPTYDGYDLVINSIEVGSYGVRQHNGFQWVYGTGLALPRYSMASKKV